MSSGLTGDRTPTTPLTRPRRATPLRLWLLIALVLFAAAGAKASLLPLLFVGAARRRRRRGGQPASPASGCRDRAGADRRRAGPGDHPPVPPDLGRAGHRPRLAALVPGRRPDRCRAGGRGLCPCPAARRPPRRPRPVVAHVGRRVRSRHPTPWLGGRSTDPAAPRDLRRRPRCGRRVLVPRAQPGLLPEGRDGRVRDPHRGRDRGGRPGAAEATGASSERWSSRRSSARWPSWRSARSGRRRCRASVATTCRASCRPSSCRSSRC